MWELIHQLHFIGGYQNVVCKQSIVTAVFVSTIVIVTVNSSHGARTPLEQSLLLLSFFKTTISLIIVIAVAAMASLLLFL